MARKRDYIAEIVEKKERHLRRADRHEQFSRRVVPLVEGFRYLLAHEPATRFRREWLKYGAIGYIACVEGYFRMLISDLINHGDPYAARIVGFKDLKISMEDLVAIHARRVSLGEYVAHLVSLNGVSDINYCLSMLIGDDFLTLFRQQPASEWNPQEIGKLLPDTIQNVDALYQLRHLFCHELAPKAVVQPRKITNYIGSAATLVWHTEELVQRLLLTDA